MSSGTQPRTGKGDEAVRRAPAGSGFIGTQFRICRDGIPACRDAVLANANAADLSGAPGNRRSYRDLPLRNRKGGDGNPPPPDARASALPDAQDCAFLPPLSAPGCDPPGQLDSGSGSNTSGMRGNISATFGRGRIASASAYPRTRPASSDSDGSRLRTVAGAGRADWKCSTSSFTHFCTTTRRGRVRPGRKPIAIRVNRTLARIDEVLRKRWHHDIREIGARLGRVWQGGLNYIAVPMSSRLLRASCRRLQRLWMGAPRRRSRRHRLDWKRLERMREILWPRVSICHPWPDQRFAVNHPRQEPDG